MADYPKPATAEPSAAELIAGIRDTVALTLIDQSKEAGGQAVNARDFDVPITFRLGQYLAEVKHTADVHQALTSVNLAAGKAALAMIVTLLPDKPTGALIQFGL